MWGKRNKVILFRQACISLSKVLWHSMDLTSSQHNNLQNELMRKLERPEGKIFLISLYCLVALRSIVKYKEQSVLLTMSNLLINFSEELGLRHLYRKCNRERCCGILAMQLVSAVPADSGPSSFLPVPGILPATGSRE